MATSPSQNPIEEAILTLLQDEALVLYWKCKRYDHVSIAGKVGWSDDWVQLRMVRIYKKLGFKKEMHWTRRMRVLRQEICPLFNKLIDNDIRNIEKIFPLVEPENIEPEIIEVIEEKPPSTVEISNEEAEVIKALILYDEEQEEEDEAIDAEPVDEPPRPEPPPIIIKTPRQLPGPTPEDRQRIFGVIGLVLFVIFLGYIFFRPQNQVSNRKPTEEATQVPTDLPTESLIVQALTAQADATELPTSAPTPTKTPTVAPSPTLAPTAIPLPIREDFTNQYSDLWITMGDVFIGTGSSFNDYPGVLTTNFQENGSIQIGNTSWTDYIVSMRAGHLYLYTNLILGVRVKDRNNMVGLECDAYDCNWFVIHKGVKEELGGDQSMKMIRKFALTVEGDRFAAIGTYEQNNMLLVLPPKYAGQFPGGGVYLEISGVEVDFIEISPFQ